MELAAASEESPSRSAWKSLFGQRVQVGIRPPRARPSPWTEDMRAAFLERLEGLCASAPSGVPPAESPRTLVQLGGDLLGDEEPSELAGSHRSERSRGHAAASAPSERASGRPLDRAVAEEGRRGSSADKRGASPGLLPSEGPPPLSGRPEAEGASRLRAGWGGPRPPGAPPRPGAEGARPGRLPQPQQHQHQHHAEPGQAGALAPTARQGPQGPRLSAAALQVLEEARGQLRAQRGSSHLAGSVGGEGRSAPASTAADSVPQEGPRAEWWARPAPHAPSTLPSPSQMSSSVAPFEHLAAGSAAGSSPQRFHMPRGAELAYSSPGRSSSPTASVDDRGSERSPAGGTSAATGATAATVASPFAAGSVSRPGSASRPRGAAEGKEERPDSGSQLQWQAVEEAIAQAAREVLAAEESARKLAATRDDLQQQVLEHQLVGEGPLLLGSLKRRSARLQVQISDMKEEAQHLVARALELEAEQQELKLEAERLQSDHRDASEKLWEQNAMRAAIWERVAALAAACGAPPLPPSAPPEALAAQIGTTWAEAQRLELQRQAEWSELARRREELRGGLAAAQQADRAATERLAAVEKKVAASQRLHQQEEREAKEELAAARAEHRAMAQAASDWQQVRPQLLALIHDLREGNREGAAMEQGLADELVALRGAIEEGRKSEGAAASRGGPHARAAVTEGSVEAGGAEAAAGGAEFQRATEENDHLHKRLLELQDENSRLIQEQEELIRSVKGKVEVLKRQRHFGP